MRGSDRPVAPARIQKVMPTDRFTPDHVERADLRYEQVARLDVSPGAEVYAGKNTPSRHCADSRVDVVTIPIGCRR